MSCTPNTQARDSGLFSELYIGLMSGTSLDGVDGVLLTHTGSQWQTLSHAHRPFAEELKQALFDLNTPGDNELHRSAMASQALVHVYAEVVTQLCQNFGIKPHQVKAIGAHGQTVRHRPELGYTLQLNNPALLAELTGIDVVADFRSRDVAAGGQGAPLVPAFHQAIFGQSTHTVAVLNVGGMANVSILRPAQAPLGFDTGPGNALLDMWCEKQTGQAFDANGNWGAMGVAQEDWLENALAHPFFQTPPPKSTGRDLFNPTWLNDWLLAHGISHQPGLETRVAQNVQATLCELTARSAAQAIDTFAPEASQLIVCGGGALNGDLMQRLQRNLPKLSVISSADMGLDVMQVEAAAFAWLAWTHCQRLAGNVPVVTGAEGPRVLGALYPAR